MYNTLPAKLPHQVAIAHPNVGISVWTGNQACRRVKKGGLEISANILPWRGRLWVRARYERTEARSPRSRAGLDGWLGGVDTDAVLTRPSSGSSLAGLHE